jgi:Lrp/AsnC family leucine-responsive transcriptional regulator
MEIKKIDTSILRELMINGRAEFTTIAKKLNVPKSTIRNRYKAMEKAGVILGATTHVNYKKCGFGFYTHFTIRMNPNQRDDALKKILKLPGIYIAIKGVQNFLLYVGISIKGLDEIDKVKNVLSSLTLADDIKSEIWLDIKNSPENLKIFLEKDQIYTPNQSIKRIDLISENINCKLDEVDFKIIDLLSINGRMSFRAISKKVGKSHDTITRRYKNLVRNGILKVVSQINPIKLGYKAWIVFNLLFSAKIDLSEKINEIIMIPDVIHLVKAKGIFDLVVYAFVRNIDEFFEMQDKISNLTGLINIEIITAKVLEVWPIPKQHISTL